MRMIESAECQPGQADGIGTHVAKKLQQPGALLVGGQGGEEVSEAVGRGGFKALACVLVDRGINSAGRLTGLVVKLPQFVAIRQHGPHVRDQTVLPVNDTGEGATAFPGDAAQGCATVLIGNRQTVFQKAVDDGGRRRGRGVARADDVGGGLNGVVVDEAHARTDGLATAVGSMAIGARPRRRVRIERYDLERLRPVTPAGAMLVFGKRHRGEGTLQGPMDGGLHATKGERSERNRRGRVVDLGGGGQAQTALLEQVVPFTFAGGLM